MQIPAVAIIQSEEKRIAAIIVRLWGQLLNLRATRASVAQICEKLRNFPGPEGAGTMVTSHCPQRPSFLIGHAKLLLFQLRANQRQSRAGHRPVEAPWYALWPARQSLWVKVSSSSSANHLEDPTRFFFPLYWPLNNLQTSHRSAKLNFHLIIPEATLVQYRQ